MTELQVGQLATREQRFCPYAAMTKWPYKFLYGEVSRVVSDNYFAHGAFRARGWTIYYIRTLLTTTEKPLLLVPEKEVQVLFEEISQELDIHVTFPDITKEPGFQLAFLDEGSPRPRYLGRLTNDCSMDELEQAIPAAGSSTEEPEQLDERSLPMFRHYMQLALQANKQKSKAVRDKKKRDRISLKKKRCAELKRAQCYLGLRRRGTVQLEDYISDHNMSYEDQQKAQEEYEIAAGIKTIPLDLSVPAAYHFDRNPVFICVDIEVYEKDHRSLTEIGVTTLDTLDLIHIAPGEGGRNWMNLLRPRHFRVVEHAHMNNSEFVSGCADRFEFGQSEWVSIREVPQVLACCFKAPFSEPGKYNPHPTKMNQVTRKSSEAESRVGDKPDNKRNIVLVGHDIGSDIGYMRMAGYDVGNLPNVVEAIDTASLFRAFKHEQNPRNLGSVLLDLGLTGWNLHNAGNDATYTMQALLGTCIESLSPNNGPPSEPSTEELDEAAATARERIKEENEEWNVADEEGGDGGDPVALLPAAEAIANAEFDRAMKKGRKADERDRIKREKGYDHSGTRQREGNEVGRGGRGWGSSRGGKAPSKPKTKPANNKMGLDVDAMDEAMGFSGQQPPAAWDGSSDVPTPTTTTTMDPNVATYEKAGYLPPHLRDKQRGDSEVTKGVENNPPNKSLSERMAARLKMLDTDG